MAAQRIVAGDTLYSAAQLSGQYSPQQQFAYLYPPFLAVLVAPLTAIFSDFGSAMYLWATLGVAALVATELLLGVRRSLSRQALILVVGATLALAAVGFELVMGNVHLFLVALFVVAWLGIERGTQRGAAVAGVAIGVAALVKVFPAVLIIWFVLTRRYRAAVSAAVTMLVLAVLTVPFVGIDAWLDYPKVLANLGAPADAWSSIAPAQILGELIGAGVARLVVGALALAALVWSSRRMDAALGFATAVAVSIVIVPTMYPHYLALLVAPLLLLALYSRSSLVAMAAYVALFIGSQAALLDLREPIYRGLAAAVPLLILLALLLVAAWQNPGRAALPVTKGRLRGT